MEWVQGWYGVGTGARCMEWGQRWYRVGAGVVCSGSRGGIE